MLVQPTPAAEWLRKQNLSTVQPMQIDNALSTIAQEHG